MAKQVDKVEVEPEQGNTYSMTDEQYADYYAETLNHMSIIIRQRILKKLVRSRAVFARENKLNTANSTFSDRLMWQTRVKLSRESRLSHLYRAFLKGTPYKVVEQSNKDHTLPPLVLAVEYGKGADEYSFDFNHFILWLEGKTPSTYEPEALVLTDMI